MFKFDVYFRNIKVKPQLHCHDFGQDGDTTHPDFIKS